MLLASQGLSTLQDWRFVHLQCREGEKDISSGSERKHCQGNSQQAGSRSQEEGWEAPRRAQRVSCSEAEEQMAGSLPRSSPLGEGSREEHTVAQDNAWDSEAADGGHLVAGRVQKDSGSPERERGARCTGAAASGALKDKPRHNGMLCGRCAFRWRPRSGPAAAPLPPGTNLYVLPLTAAGRASREPRRATPGREAGPSPWEPRPLPPPPVSPGRASWRAPLAPNQRSAGSAPPPGVGSPAPGPGPGPPRSAAGPRLPPSSRLSLQPQLC